VLTSSFSFRAFLLFFRTSGSRPCKMLPLRTKVLRSPRPLLALLPIIFDRHGDRFSFSCRNFFSSPPLDARVAPFPLFRDPDRFCTFFPCPFVGTEEKDVVGPSSLRGSPSLNGTSISGFYSEQARLFVPVSIRLAGVRISRKVSVLRTFRSLPEAR